MHDLLTCHFLVSLKPPGSSLYLCGYCSVRMDSLHFQAGCHSYRPNLGFLLGLQVHIQFYYFRFNVFCTSYLLAWKKTLQKLELYFLTQRSVYCCNPLSYYFFISTSMVWHIWHAVCCWEIILMDRCT